MIVHRILHALCIRARLEWRRASPGARARITALLLLIMSPMPLIALAATSQRGFSSASAVAGKDVSAALLAVPWVAAVRARGKDLTA
jgi:hypothetical protein